MADSRMTDQLNQLRKDHRELKKALIEMAGKVGLAINALDEAMKEPESSRRGKKVASALNYLDMGNDMIMHITLDWGWRKIANFKKKIIADAMLKQKARGGK